MLCISTFSLGFMSDINVVERNLVQQWISNGSVKLYFPEEVSVFVFWRVFPRSRCILKTGAFECACE